MNVYKSDPSADGFGRLSGIYYGESFSGKTHCACTWPHPLVIAFDPDTGTARSLPGVWVLEVETWSEFYSVVMPYIRARALGKLVKERAGLTEEPLIETLVIDTISSAAQKLALETQSTKAQLTQQDYGLILTKLTEVTIHCVETMKAKSGAQGPLPTYNVIFNAHLMSEQDDSGAVLGIYPAIVGQFRRNIGKMFGFGFTCEQVMETVVENNQPRLKRRHVVRTAPKSPLHPGGDRLGGPGKTFKELPVICGGTYPELCAAWGISKESK